jgi:hypothetical protein
MILLFIVAIIVTCEAIKTSDYLYYNDSKINKDGLLTLNAKDATNESTIPEKKVKYTNYYKISKYYNPSDKDFRWKNLNEDNIYNA